MLKYLYHSIVFQEVPNEISLAISITGCKRRCPGCHSPELQSDTGDILDADTLKSLIHSNPGITCVLFMGGDQDADALLQLIKVVKDNHLKVAIYSGNTLLPPYFRLFDYIKLGPYLQHKGPITSPTTNQRFYALVKGELFDRTYLFNNIHYD